MKNLTVLSLLFFAFSALADTPPPNTVKAKTYSGDGATAITATGSALNVHVIGGITVGTVDQGAAGTDPWVVRVTSSALPTNAALEEGGRLQSIDTKTPALGQALAAGSVPVVLPAAQITTLTPPTTVTANVGTTGGLALDNTVAALQVSQGSTTSGQKGSLTQGAVSTSAPSYTNAQTSPLSLTTGGALRTDSSATTQPVSGTVTANAGTGTFGVSGTVTANAGTGTFGVSGTVTANAGTGTFTVDASGHTVPVAVVSPLPAGSNTIGALTANQSVNVAQINGTTPLMGNGTTGTGSQRVTIASDNTAFSVNAIPKTAAAVTVKQAAITVGTSAVRLTNDGSAPPATRVLLVAQLLSSSTANCFFGSSSVANSGASRGVQMFAGQVFSWSNDAGDYYAICDASSQTILITEQE